MPLPASEQPFPWPPRPIADLLPQFARWSAWYSGEPEQLIDAYGGTTNGRPAARVEAMGIRGTRSRVMWGNPLSEELDDDRLHVPLASDLCAATSELCYADPPKITASVNAAQTRIGEYVDDGMLDVAAGGTELGAALGGHYLQAVLPADSDRARLETVAYDGAWPVFDRGRLVSVAFWWTLETETGGIVWRHIELHELDPNGVGVIRHGLYQGTRERLGQRKALDARPETAALLNPGVLVDGRETWSSVTPGLDVVHIPGRTPQRLWRHHPVGRHLGRSVFQGIEGALSKLDEAYTSWMRDVDLGRARLIVADYLTENYGPGRGATFDLDKRLLVPLALPQSIGSDSTKPIEMVQFAIRVQEHQQTCQELTEVVLRAVSFSAQTFGEDEEGNAQTATAVMSKDSRSMRTRAKILGAERVGLQQIIRKMLAMDGLTDDAVTVTFPDGGQETVLQLAQTAQALRTAEAASTETLVRMIHPDWTDGQVMDEVAAIAADQANALGAAVGPDLAGETIDNPLDPKAVKDKADALGVLIRGGVDPEIAAERVGLPGLEFTGAIPTSLRPAAQDAGSLEQA